MGIREPEKRVMHLLMGTRLWIHRGCFFPKSLLRGTVSPHTGWNTHTWESTCCQGGSLSIAGLALSWQLEM